MSVSPPHSASKSCSHPLSNEQTAAWLSVQSLDFGYGGWHLCVQWSRTWHAGLALVCGGDGSGKTSLLRLLAGDLAPQAGSVWLHGPSIAKGGSDSSKDQQVFWIDPRQPAWSGGERSTPLQWVEHLRSQYRDWSDVQWQMHVQGWSLQPQLEKPFLALSAGTQRKVLIASALSSGAALTLIDEPLAGLDKASILYLQQALTACAAMTDRLVIVTHYDHLIPVPWDDVLELPDRD